MKDKTLLSISILISIMFFIYGWFADTLFNQLFVLSLCIPLILFICYVICCIFSIKNLKNTKRIKDGISLFVLIGTAIVMLVFPFRLAKVKVELSLYEQDRNKIVEMVKNNELKISDDSKNELQLPKDLRKTSSDGTIMVFQDDEENTLVSFWVFRGTMSESTILIYSDDGEELIRKNSWIDQIKSIKELKEHWFYVVTNY